MRPARSGQSRNDDRSSGRRQTWRRHAIPAVLVLLNSASTHGYDLRARLRDLLPQADLPDASSLYRLLRMIEAEGAVESTWDVPEAGAARRIYTLTDVGREQLALWSLELEQDIEALQRLLTAIQTTALPAPAADPATTECPG
jgi:PadR family transcriptional regulator PadR